MDFRWHKQQWQNWLFYLLLGWKEIGVPCCSISAFPFWLPAYFNKHFSGPAFWKEQELAFLPNFIKFNVWFDILQLGYEHAELTSWVLSRSFACAGLLIMGLCDWRAFSSDQRANHVTDWAATTLLAMDMEYLLSALPNLYFCFNFILTT